MEPSARRNCQIFSHLGHSHIEHFTLPHHENILQAFFCITWSAMSIREAFWQRIAEPFQFKLATTLLCAFGTTTEGCSHHAPPKGKRFLQPLFKGRC
eukprot:1147085-Pelagomonas_calceolata.AAC.3